MTTGLRVVAGPKYWAARETMRRRGYQAEVGDKYCWDCVERTVCPRVGSCPKWGR